jgi:hypothetical protein
MQNLKIKAELAGKTVTKDLGWTKLTIEIDKVKPAQYGRLFQMGLTEIFEDGKREEEKREHTSNTETENSGGATSNVGRTQAVAKKTRKKRPNS